MKNTSQTTDSELLAAIADDNRLAFETLVRRYGGDVIKFCRHLMADRELAEDAAQETWAKLWRRRHSYHELGKFRAYLFMIARRSCFNMRRTARRKHRLEHHLRQQDGETVTMPDQATSVEKLLQALPEKQSHALLLRFAFDLDYKSIGSVLGCREATARARTFHGLKKMRELMGEQL